MMGATSTTGVSVPGWVVDDGKLGLSPGDRGGGATIIGSLV
jgi:hypothetical protein